MTVAICVCSEWTLMSNGGTWHCVTVYNIHISLWKCQQLRWAEQNKTLALVGGKSCDFPKDFLKCTSTWLHEDIYIDILQIPTYLSVIGRKPFYQWLPTNHSSTFQEHTLQTALLIKIPIFGYGYQQAFTKHHASLVPVQVFIIIQQTINICMNLRLNTMYTSLSQTWVAPHINKYIHCVCTHTLSCIKNA